MQWPFKKFYRQDLGDYMERWIALLKNGDTRRLHHILRGDADPDPHDHPWNFWSIILWGSYQEEVWEVVDGTPTKIRTWRPGKWWPRFVRAEALHRLILEDGPVWTFVFTGSRIRHWGYATPAGHVKWEEYQSRKNGFDQAAYAEQIKQVYG